MESNVFIKLTFLFIAIVYSQFNFVKIKGI